MKSPARVVARGGTRRVFRPEAYSLILRRANPPRQEIGTQQNRHARFSVGGNLESGAVGRGRAVNEMLTVHRLNFGETSTADTFVDQRHRVVPFDRGASHAEREAGAVAINRSAGPPQACSKRRRNSGG
jgi:hypothetical protein